MASAITTFAPVSALVRARSAMRAGASGSLRSPCAASKVKAARVVLRGASVNRVGATARMGSARRMVVSVTADDGEEEMMIEEESIEKMEKSVSVLEDNLTTVRTGRANPAVLDRLEVEYYGAPCDLKSLATVNTPDAQTLMIQPFDKTSIQAIEKAIMTSDLGLNPSNDGNVIRLGVPPLTQERRQELAKLVSKLGEDAKVALRNVRRDATKSLQKMEKDGSSGKDTVAVYCKSIDDLTAKYVKQIDDTVTKKEKEIMTV